MKEILAVLLLLTVVDASPFLGRFLHGAWGNYHEPSGPWSGPPGHSFNPPGHSSTPPAQQNLPLCTLLEQLFSYKVNQLNNDMDKSCTAAWICHKPETGDMTITYMDGREVTLNLQFQQNKRPNQNGAQNTENLGHSNCNPGNVDNVNHNTPFPNTNENHSKSNLQTSTLPIYVPTTEPRTDEPVHQSGGEGLIDVRIGDV